MSKFRFDNMDASESAFFSRQLEHIRPGVLEVLTPELIGLSLVPMASGIHPGAEDFTYRYFEEFGKAELMTDYSKRAASANIAGHEATSKIRGIGASYAYSIQESRAAALAGTGLDARKAAAARKAIAQRLDDVLLLGDGSAPYHGLRGLFALASTATYSTPNGASGDTEWESKTPDEIAADMHGIANGIVLGSKGIHVPNTLVLPLSSYNLVNTKRMGDGSNMTILEFFRSTSTYVKTVVSSTKLETAGSGPSKRMVCYQRDPMILESIVPIEFEQLAPQFDGYQVLTSCHARTGGVVNYYPKAISYGDTI
jgi:hypothetical protein